MSSQTNSTAQGPPQADPAASLIFAGGIAVDVAELAGVVVEGCLFGIFTVLFFISLDILTRKRRHSKLNIPMITAAVTMMCLAVAQLVVDTVNIFKAFIDKPDRLSRIMFMQDVTQPIFSAKHAIYFTMMLVGDTIVIYRTFIVWGKNYWIIILPALCSLGSAAAAYETVWAFGHFASTTIKAQTDWGLAVLVLSMSANIIATSLLAVRIWNSERSLSNVMDRKTGYTSSSSHIRVIKIILESGAVNAAYLIAYTAVLRVGNHGLEIMACISTPLIGIIFTVVIIRAARSSERQATAVASMKPFSSSSRSRGTTAVQISVQSHSENDMEMGKYASQDAY